MKKELLIIIAVLIVGIVIYFGYKTFALDKCNYVTIDINKPQIEFILNNKNKVVKALGLNEEADIVLNGLELKGLSLEKATKLITEDAIKTGYITGYINEIISTNRIDITVYVKDKKKNKNIEEKIVNQINNTLEENKLSSKIIVAELRKEQKKIADQKNINYTKMLLIERAYSLDNSLDKEKLMKLSTKKIQEHIEKGVENRIANTNMNKEEYYEEIKQQKELKIERSTKRQNYLNDRR